MRAVKEIFMLLIKKMPAVTVLPLLLLFSGCAGWGEEKSEVLIGVLAPAQGGNAKAAEQVIKGIGIAADGVNNSGGVEGRRIKLEVIRYKNPRQAVRDFDRLADSGAAAVIGTYSSEEVTPLKSAANRRKLLLVLPMASSDELTERTDYVVRNCYNDTLQSRALMYYARYLKDKKRLGVLVNLDEGAVFARDIAYKAAQCFNDYGGTVAGMAGFREKDRSFAGPLKKLMDKNIDILLLPAYPECAGKIIAEARKLGYTGMIISPDSVSEKAFFEALPENAGEVYFSSPYSQDYLTENTANFRTIMRRNEITSPGDGEAQGYDALNLIAAALQADDAPYKAIRKLNHHAGASGPVIMREDGNADHMIFINKIEYGKDGKASPKLELGVDPLLLRDVTIDKKE